MTEADLIAPCSVKASVTRDEISLEILDEPLELYVEVDLTTNVLTVIVDSKFVSMIIEDEKLIELGDVVTEIVEKSCEIVDRNEKEAFYVCSCGFSKEVLEALSSAMGKNSIDKLLANYRIVRSPFSRRARLVKPLTNL